MKALKIPEGWYQIRVEDIGNTYGGLSGKTKNDFGEGYKYIPYTNIFKNYQINLEQLEFVKIKKGEVQSKVKYGDIFFTTSSETSEELAMSSVLTKDLEDTYLNSFCFGLRPSNKISLNPLYSSYLFRGQIFRTRMNILGQGSTRINLPKKDYLRELIILPQSPKEQEKIAEILTTIDETIENTDKLIGKYKKIKAGLMEDLFTKGIDVHTGKSHTRFKDSELGRIPEIWGLENIGNSSYLKGRIGWQGLRADEFIDYGPFLVTGTDFIAGKINWEGCYHISEKRFNEAPLIHLKNGDIVVTKDGTVGKIAIIKKCPVKAILNSGIFLLRPNNLSYLPEYMYYVLNSKIFDNFLSNALAGSTIKHLYQNVFVKFIFPVPSKKEQEKIAEILTEADNKIEKEEAYKEKLEKIKKGLMDDLLTGKVRVKF